MRGQLLDCHSQYSRMLMTVYLLVIAVLFLVVLYRRFKFCMALRSLPGPPALPLLGNSLLLTGGQDVQGYLKQGSGHQIGPCGDQQLPHPRNPANRAHQIVSCVEPFKLFPHNGFVHGQLEGFMPTHKSYSFGNNNAALFEYNCRQDFFRLMCDCAEKYGDMFCLWVGQRPFLFIYRAEAIQPIFSSTLHIDKSYEYGFLKPWLGNGLLTATGKKWHLHRKLLTPAFHSRVLEGFLQPIHKQSMVLVSKLREQLDKPGFDMVPFAKLAALDLICDTAMGVPMNAQMNSHSEYVLAIDRITEILQRRFITPWLKPDIIFQHTLYGKKQQKYLKIIHNFTAKVIQERKEEKMKQKLKKAAEFKPDQKKRQHFALLDLLLELSMNGQHLSDEELLDEVNTFMFAGHDTTAASIVWCLFVLGHHLNVQQKIVEELWCATKGEEETWPTMKQIQNLEYLEHCIKESLRLYPVVPLIARDIKIPVKVLNQELPPGITVLVNAYLLHRDPRYFPNPYEFHPERFQPKNCEKRHPFAYIPFSAGSRNCIGQKFAMIELKIILATILKNYQVQSLDSESQLNLLGELVLLNRGGVRLSIMPRI